MSEIPKLIHKIEQLEEKISSLEKSINLHCGVLLNMNDSLSSNSQTLLRHEKQLSSLGGLDD